MHILFVHQNFPAQFRYIAPRLISEYGFECSFCTERAEGEIPDVKKILYKPRGGATVANSVFTRNFENAVAHAHGVFDALKQAPEVKPDLVVAHTGFGSSLFMPFLYDAPVINFLEFLYSPVGQDLGFRPEIPVGETELLRSRTNNAMIMLDLLNCDRGWTPTHYQRDFFPAEWRNKIEVIFDGIDTEVYHRKDGAEARIREMYKIDPSHRIVSYVARGFEMIRGFDVFVRAAKIVCQKRDDVTFVVVGTDKVHYGSDLKYIKEATFRHQILADEKPDLSRFRFVGYVQQEVLADILSATDVHLYLTEPFIASWSMVDAMACRAVLIASDQTCVREYVVPDENGLLVNFFDHEALAEKTLEVLANPAKFSDLARAAEKTVVEKFSLDVAIPKLARFFQEVGSGTRRPSITLDKLTRAGTLKLITSDPEELARKAKITESPTGQPMTRTIPSDALTPAAGAQESAVAMIRELGEKARTVTDWVRVTLGFSGPAPYTSIGPRNHPSDLNRLLRRLAEWKAKVIVDVGEREGGAFFLFAQMATETARLIVTGSSEREIPADRVGLIEAMPRPRQSLAMIPSASDNPDLTTQIETALAGDPIDFLFLHGRRPYTPLSADYQSLSKLVRPGGLIAWDGIGPATPFGPDRDGGHRLWIDVQSTFPQRAEYLNGCATEYGGMAMIKI
jgi:glycosyltransferase involved in cell wall biosynthesis/cephalosporin hydroxylase